MKSCWKFNLILLIIRQLFNQYYSITTGNSFFYREPHLKNIPSLEVKMVFSRSKTWSSFEYSQIYRVKIDWADTLIYLEKYWLSLERKNSHFKYSWIFTQLILSWQFLQSGKSDREQKRLWVSKFDILRLLIIKQVDQQCNKHLELLQQRQPSEYIDEIVRLIIYEYLSAMEI